MLSQIRCFASSNLLWISSWFVNKILYFCYLIHSSVLKLHNQESDHCQLKQCQFLWDTSPWGLNISQFDECVPQLVRYHLPQCNMQHTRFQCHSLSIMWHMVVQYQLRVHHLCYWLFGFGCSCVELAMHLYFLEVWWTMLIGHLIGYKDCSISLHG